MAPDDQRPSYFETIPSLYRYIDFVVRHYKYDKIDILMGHSTGGLIATCYAEFKNRTRTDDNLFVNRLCLSSPFFAFDGNETLLQIVSAVGLVFKTINIKSASGTPNDITTEEYCRVPFNDIYKSLLEPPALSGWVRAVSLQHSRIANEEVNVRCRTTVYLSSQSAKGFSPDSDNILNVVAIKSLAGKINGTGNVCVVDVPNSAHSVFLSTDFVKTYLRPYLSATITENFI